ncbi:Tab2/Atab2 family RNA-binding protein [Aerosakkonemataceae cyanobacterium BLCC-F154]|uniref:Tab2/Atab2 family RNA-binding protein n=1 Tax=Floridaenema fluviatile BLCC-F154 TaxID=3153640 RepID=A0ABV4YIK6_9CYAN
MTTIWELDFYSRPIVDENKKKVWEVLICESSLDVNQSGEDIFRYSQYCSNQEVNSVWLGNAIKEAMEKSGQTPQKIRFFRTQMNNMISKACKDLEISSAPSRRTFNLNQWLAKRMAEVYSTHPGYTPATTNPSVLMPSGEPQNLPEALLAEKWAFVTLEAAAFAEMPEWEIGFQEAFPLKSRGVNPDTRIPGMIFFSSRALPLAAWISGLELASLKFESLPQTSLLLETGVNDSWILANIKDAGTIAEAQNFEAAKQKANGVHFLAVQTDPQAESFAGFWLLQESGSI